MITGNDAGVASQPLPFRVLTVCTGNICRSPMAERLLRAGLDERFPGQFIVESAGTGALVGNPIDPRVAGSIRVFGGSAEYFSARQLTTEILREQDLVLALTRAHRSRVVELAPAMLKKTFTLREFARLLPLVQLDDELTGPHRWMDALPRAQKARSAYPGRPDGDDIVDPFNRGDSVHEQMLRQLEPAVDTILRHL